MASPGGAGAGAHRDLPLQLANCFVFLRGGRGTCYYRSLPYSPCAKGTLGDTVPSLPVPPCSAAVLGGGNLGWKEGEHAVPQNLLSPARLDAASLMSPAGDSGDDALTKHQGWIWFSPQVLGVSCCTPRLWDPSWPNSALGTGNIPLGWHLG